MRKVWVTRRKGIDGQYVEWYDEAGRRKSKYFHPRYKKYVQPFSARKFAELNSDVRPPGAVIDRPWDVTVKEYQKRKILSGLAAQSLYDINHTLAMFSAVCRPFSTGQINTRMIDTFILHLKNMRSTRLDRERTTKSDKVYLKASPNTINKHLRNLRAFISWGQKRRYMTEEIEIHKVKARGKNIRVLSNSEIKRLLAACGNDRQWRMRILLAVCTGLRRSDIDNLRVQDIDIERKTISLIEGKTGKVKLHQPLPESIMPHIHRFIAEDIQDGQSSFFKYGWSQKWYTILRRAGLGRVEFHDLRRTFGSLQADAGVPIKALQEMYNHASIETTMKHYIKTDESEKRNGVNKLRVMDWL